MYNCEILKTAFLPLTFLFCPLDSATMELSLAGEGRGGMVLLQSGCSEYRLAHGWTGFELRAAPLSRTSHWLVKTKDSVMEKRPAWS